LAPKKSGSKKVGVQKYKVKFYFSTVRGKVIPILKRIEVGDYPSKIARLYGWSKQHVYYYLKKLEKAGLIRCQVRSSAVFYVLTGRGKKVLTSCEGVVYGSGVFRLHKCQVLFPVVREGVYPSGDFREVEMVNWTALLGLVNGVSVRKTTRHWIVHVETLYGRSPGELIGLAKNLGDRVARALMSKYGVLLGEGQVGNGYELAIDDPVAKLLSRYFTISTPKRKMDHSLGELEGEIDHLTRDAAVEYLLMPERVRKMEGQISGLSSQLDDVESGLQKLVDVLNRLGQMEEPDEKPEAKSGDKGELGGYVC
jgi:DNA-binding MarR family transcriptional regulator